MNRPDRSRSNFPASVLAGLIAAALWSLATALVGPATAELLQAMLLALLWLPGLGPRSAPPHRTGSETRSRAHL